MNSSLRRPPECPNSWHYVGRSTDVGSNKPFHFTLYGQEYVFFRDAEGMLVGTSPKCAHLGACLGKGAVKEGRLVCAFHAWEYDNKGQCVKIPAGDVVPKHAKLTQYPVYEKWDLIFFFNHPQKAYDFPFFEDMDRDSVVRSGLFEVWQEGIWFTVPSNAFDTQHFIHVHKRTPLKEPVMEIASRHHAQIEYEYKVESNFWTDRLMCTLFGNEARLNFVNYSGNLILATTQVGSFENRMLIFIRPLTATTSVSQIFVFRKKKHNALGNLIQKGLAQFQAKASQSFFGKEAKELRGTDIVSGNFVPSDKNLVNYFKWLGDSHPS